MKSKKNKWPKPKNSTEDPVHCFLTYLCDRMPLSNQWTERHANEAAGVLFNYECQAGYLSDKEIDERLSSD
jgi:hypothetical protein